MLDNLWAQKYYFLLTSSNFETGNSGLSEGTDTKLDATDAKIDEETSFVRWNSEEGFIGVLNCCQNEVEPSQQDQLAGSLFFWPRQLLTRLCEFEKVVKLLTFSHQDWWEGEPTTRFKRWEMGNFQHLLFRKDWWFFLAFYVRFFELFPKCWCWWRLIDAKWCLLMLNNSYYHLY